MAATSGMVTADMDMDMVMVIIAAIIATGAIIAVIATTAIKVKRLTTLQASPIWSLLLVLRRN
jgi:uncharacterized membrane protein YhaH (DUF805 family)